MLTTPQGQEIADKIAIEVAANVGHRLRKALNRVDRPREKGVLFPAELGHPCQRKSWYDFNYDSATMKPVEPLGPGAKMKFAYGDLVESLIVPLAQATGHQVDGVNQKVEWSVTGQDAVVRGRIDLVIDDHVVDVKSMAARSFDRWSLDGIKADSFGYSAQVEAYRYGISSDKPAYILAIDKEGGKMKLVAAEQPDVQALAGMKVLVSTMPESSFSGFTGHLKAVPDGKSGNMKLGVACSYCKYKEECWSKSNGGKGLRRFKYSYGPVWLTEVYREPLVEETTGR